MITTHLNDSRVTIDENLELEYFDLTRQKLAEI